MTRNLTVFGPAQWVWLFLWLPIVWLGASPLVASEAQVEDPPPSSMVDTRLPGVQLAEGISSVTGLAISPLWGTSVIGAWQYWRTEAALRERLPWFCHPGVWITGFALLSLCLLKDVLGTSAPPLIKKPLDVVDVFEDKLSALVASAAVVPFLAAQMKAHGEPWVEPSAMMAEGADHAILATASSPLLAELWSLETWLVLPLFLFVMLVVWLTSHAINVLVVLSPFSIVDALLKAAKGGLLVLVAGSSALNPWLGLLVCLPIIIVALLLAGWSYRLTVFGTLFGIDILFDRFTRGRGEADHPSGFLATAVGKAPVRSFGKVEGPADDEGAEVWFAYRPFLIFPKRRVSLPRERMVVGRGLFFPSLIDKEDERGKSPMLVMLRPRYRGREEAIAAALGATAVEDSLISKGTRAMKEWFRAVVARSRPARLPS